MIKKLQAKIKELELKKESLRRDFTEYEVEWLDNYVELKKIDGAINVLKDMLIEEITRERGLL